MKELEHLSFLSKHLTLKLANMKKAEVYKSTFARRKLLNRLTTSNTDKFSGYLAFSN